MIKELFKKGVISAARLRAMQESPVERILKSETYAGILVQGKTSITERNEKNRIQKPEADWVVIKSAHKHPTKDYPIEENIFDNVLYCGVCGRKMTRNSYVAQYADGERARLDGYFCLNGGQTKAVACPESNRISKNELLDIRSLSISKV